MFTSYVRLAKEKGITKRPFQSDTRERVSRTFLEMTFGEGLDFFSNIPSIKRILELLVRIGLDYLTFRSAKPHFKRRERRRG